MKDEDEGETKKARGTVLNLDDPRVSQAQRFGIVAGKTAVQNDLVGAPRRR